MELAKKESRRLSVYCGGKIKMSDYLPSLKKSIKTGRIGQAKTLLGKLHSHPLPEKHEVLQMLALAPDKIALELLYYVTSEKYRDPDIYDRLIQLITDRAHLNFNFALILFSNADDEVLSHSIPLIKHILSNETDKELLNKIIRTSGKLKLERLTDDIAEFIFYDDAMLKSEAVKALERIGTPFSCEKLLLASKTEKCDQNILDAIQVLKTKDSVQKSEPPTSVISTPKIDDHRTELEKLACDDVTKQFEALIFLSDKGSEVSSALSKSLKSQSNDLLINLLHLVARTIPVEAVNALFSIINDKKMNNLVKFAAYNALEAYPELESAASVVKGLSEPVMYVRLAAIKALDKNLSDFVCAEIKNKIESGTKKGEMLAETILDANAKNIIQYLMISDTFSYMASNYFTRKTPIKILDTFIDILQNRNLKSTSKKYMDLRKQKIKKEKAPFIVISPSNAILDTYSKLIYSSGFSCKTFPTPQDAFEAFVFERPSAIICDLFLNDMTGIDLAREAREIYTKDDVPIIISILQKDFDSDILGKEIEDAGVNILCEFPAKTSQIKSWVK